MSLWPETTNRTRIYYFLVVALGVFLLVLAFGRDHRGQYTAQAQLQPLQEVAAYRPLDLSEVRRAVLAQEAINQVHGELMASGGSNAALVSETSILEGLRVKSLEGGPVILSFETHDRDSAKLVVGRLAELFVATRSEADQRVVAASIRDQETNAVRAAAEAAAARDAAQQALDDYEPEPVEQPEQAVQFPRASLVGDATANTTEGTGSPAEEPIDEIKRDVQMLIGQIEDQERYRRQLKSRMTVKHPQVVDINQKIEALQGQLQTARARLDDLRQRFIAQKEAELAEPAPVDNDDAQRTALEEQLQAAQQQCDLRDREQQQLADRLQQLSATKTWAATPAEEVRYRSQSTPLTLLVFSTALAMVAGSGMLFAASGIVRTIEGPAAAEQALGVPVVGTVPVVAPPSADGTRIRLRFVKLTMLFFEITLGVFLFGMLLSAMLADDFAAQFRTDPLSALADGVARLWQLLVGR